MNNSHTKLFIKIPSIEPVAGQSQCQVINHLAQLYIAHLFDFLTLIGSSCMHISSSILVSNDYVIYINGNKIG